ncbi:hypothetical protein ED733_006355 [Metarhizium rileyi]|uniref:Carbohydrate-binding domain, family 9-like, subgroup n=1 Tax=Metarhizium rileyi (strain RCEF 4871) TaxID=1649241 RepID=A0A5C6GID8_METRR|nr:hypothetical protein ED733_006355 [Metarhizium rileyi]
MARLVLIAALASFVLANPSNCDPEVPSVTVPACSHGVGTIKYDKTVPDLKPFPRTQADLCYTDTHLDIKFTAHEEVNFYSNSSQRINGDIWEYEVMEAFIYKGTDNPQTYLEFEVSPNNVTYQAFVYNPSKVRADGAPFDHLFVPDPAADGFSAVTKLNKPENLWVSDVKIPLGLFNIDSGSARGTQWRMNFFRTVVSPQTYPDQGLGAWSVPNKASFHITPYFGKVTFV